MPPNVLAVLAPVAAHLEQEHSRSPSGRFVREPARHRVSQPPLAAAAVTPVIGLNDPAHEDRSLVRHELPGHLQPEVVKTAEGREVRRLEGSVTHVEVSRMGV